MNWIRPNCFSAFLLGMMATISASAEVELPVIFGDHMVLQGDSTVPVWGTASPREKIKVSLGFDHASCKADCVAVPDRRMVDGTAAILLPRKR